MTPQEYDGILAKLEMTEADIHRLFSIIRQTASNWSTGQKSIMRPYAMLLRLLVSGKIKASDIERVKDE
jgi:hypothetical protein